MPNLLRVLTPVAYDVGGIKARVLNNPSHAGI
jgi:hypothetical protein